MTCVIEVLWASFNETSLAVSTCVGPALKAIVVPAALCSCSAACGVTQQEDGSYSLEQQYEVIYTVW